MPHHLSRIFWLCAALCVGCMVVLPAPRSSAVAPPSASAHASVNAAVSDFVAAINETRSVNGLQTLTVHPVMVTSAAQWTEGMVNRSHLSHASLQHLTATNPAGLSKIGENVGRGKSVDSLFAAFMTSPGHRKNILDPAFTHIGVAVARHPSDGRLYTTHRFATLEQPQAEPSPVATPAPLPTATPEPKPATAAPEAESELSLKVAPEGTASIVAALERGSRRVITPEPLQRRGDRRATD